MGQTSTLKAVTSLVTLLTRSLFVTVTKDCFNSRLPLADFALVQPELRVRPVRPPPLRDRPLRRHPRRRRHGRGALSQLRIQTLHSPTLVYKKT